MKTLKKYTITGTFRDKEKAEKAYEAAMARNCTEDDFDLLMNSRSLIHNNRRNDMKPFKKYTVTGTFENRENAEKAYEVAREQNCTEEDLDILMSEEAQKTYFADSEHTEIKEHSQALKGAGVGGVAGLGLGALITGGLAIGAPIAIPGLVIVGPLAGALVGAGAGGAAGGITGALIGAGMKEEQAEIYKSSIESGQIVMGVHTDDKQDADHIAQKWRELGALVVISV